MPMPLGLNVSVIRAAWLGLVPLAMWICGFLLVALWGKSDKSRLLKMLLWALPVFLIPTAWALYIMVTVSRNAF
jgi:hypothetical protein